MSGINNPAGIGTRSINIEELRRSEWLIVPAWLKRPQSEWPEQVNHVFASDEENIPSSVFMTQSDETEAVTQWERFSNFNRLVNTMAVAEEIGSIGLGRGTLGWDENVAEQFGPSKQQSSNAVAGSLKNVKKDTNDKRFSTYLKSTSRLQQGVGELAAQLRVPSVPKTPEIINALELRRRKCTRRRFSSTERVLSIIGIETSAPSRTLEIDT